MKLSIFGGTGRVGRQLVTQALAEGHDVRVLTRDPAKLTIQDPRLVIVSGDVHDPGKVAETVAGS